MTVTRVRLADAARRSLALPDLTAEQHALGGYEVVSSQPVHPGKSCLPADDPAGRCWKCFDGRTRRHSQHCPLRARGKR